MVTEAPSCTRCGHPVYSGARFCQNCGADVSQEQGQVPTAPLVAPLAPRVSALDLLRQETLGEYEILAELGRGGMATVYLAHDLALDRRVAIKVMSTNMVEEGVAERFRREARTAAALNHPHIIPIYAVRERPDLLYFVMKFIMGQSLDPILKTLGSLPIPMAQMVLSQAASALGYAHRRGVIHRDVKPANIMLDEEGWVVVTDFGIAKVTTATGLTMTGVTVGTPAYMSPEQCMGREVTGASDQYSLGIVAYQLITGQKPFTATTAMAMMYAHFNDTPRPLRELRPDCPPELEAAVLRMLAKEPGDRWPSIDEAFSAVHIPTDDATRHHLASIALSNSNLSAVAQISTPTSPVPPARPSTSRPGAVTPSSVPSVTAMSGPPTPTSGRRLQRTDAAPAAPAARQTPVLIPPVEQLPQMPPLAAPRAPTRRIWVWPAVAAVILLLGFVLLRGRRPGTEAPAGPAPQVVVDSSAALVTPPVTVPPAESAEAKPAPAPPATPAPVAVGRVLLSPARLALEPGRAGRFRLELQAAGGGALNESRPARWSSSAPAVVSVDSTGTVQALKPGRAAITVSVEGKSARAQVDVTAPAAPQPSRPAPVASVNVTPATATLPVGASATLQAAPLDAAGALLAGRSVTWSVSGSAVTVSPLGEVTAVSPGRAEVRAEVEDHTGTAVITVLPPPVAEVRLNHAADSLRPGQTLQLSASPRDARGTVLADRSVAWSSSDSSVATVAGGLVTARRAGAARITATVEDRAAAALITVLPPPVDPAVERARAVVEITRTEEALVAALNARNMAQLRRAYPGMSATEEQNWKSLLENKAITRLSATLMPIGEPRVELETAESRFRLALQFTTPGSPPSASEVEYRALFQRSGGRWQLNRLLQQ